MGNTHRNKKQKSRDTLTTRTPPLSEENPLYVMDESHRLKHTFKLIVLGEPNVGKTALLNRFVDGTFEKKARMTAGPEFKSRSLRTQNNDLCTLKIFDTCGQERFRSITSSFYRGAQCVLLVYDVTNPKSFQVLEKWRMDVYRYGSNDALVVLVGTKTDLDAHISEPVHRMMALDLDTPLAYRVSARTGDNIESMFAEITNTMVQI